jgi:hypothetical protein
MMPRKLAKTVRIIVEITLLQHAPETYYLISSRENLILFLKKYLI